MLSEIKIFRDFLTINKSRWTPQRERILEIFLKTTGHISADDLQKIVREIDPNIGITTTYRTSSLLVQCVLAEKTMLWVEKVMR